MLEPAHNEILGPPPRHKYLFIGRGTVMMRVPALARHLRRYIEMARFRWPSCTAPTGSVFRSTSMTTCSADCSGSF